MYDHLEHVGHHHNGCRGEGGLGLDDHYDGQGEVQVDDDLVHHHDHDRTV